MATSYNLNDKTQIKKKAPKDLKPTIAAMLSALPRGKTGIYADALWTGSKSKQWGFKVNQDEMEAIALNFGEKPGPKGFVTQAAGYKLKFIMSAKKSAGSGAADAKTTRMQELGSAWILRRALKDNVKYSKWQDIMSDPKYAELEAIYPGISDEWIQGYFAQQKKMLEVYASSKFDEFNREGGFMGYVSNLIKDKFGISQKDNWNPADIWLIQNERSVMKTIEETVDGNGSQTILELNAVLRKMFDEEKVVGVSLKKISGKTAKWQKYNVDDLGLTDTYNYDANKFQCDLSLKGEGEFQTLAVRVFVEGNNAVYNFQIQGNDTSKVSNLKFEPTEKGASSARMGKAPVAMVGALLKDAKVDFENDHRKYPKTAAEFSKEIDEYKKIYNKLKSKGVEVGESNADTAMGNISAIFLTKPHAATSKLMGMKFIHSVVTMPKKKMNEFMTDMVFIAAKKGKRFGPFGKLY